MIDMEIINLKTFKAIVDEQGIKGASLALNTVQSNITIRIQKLEQELQSKLFELKGRRLELTTAGHTLYEYADQILNLEQQARKAVDKVRGNYTLRIGTPETFAAVHLPQALKKLRKAHSEIEVKLSTATSGFLTEQVLKGEVDCAFAGGTVQHPELNAIAVVCEELVLVEPLGIPCAPVMIVREEGCAYRKCALSWQQNVAKHQQEIMLMSSVEGLLGCIAAGLGYTIIGKNMVQNSRYENALSSRKVTVGDSSVTISLIYRKDSPLSEGIQAFAKLFL